MATACAYRAERLRRALALDGRVAALGLDVTVEADGQVVVRGAVSTRACQGRVAAVLARRVPPGTPIRDETTLVPIRRPGPPTVVR